MKRLWLITLLTTATSCNRSPAPEPQKLVHTERAAEPSAGPSGDGGAHEDEPEGHHELPTKVRLPENVIVAAGIKTGLVTAEALPQTVSLTGQVISDPDRTAKVTARVAGRIVDVAFKEGDRVEKGSLLAVIESPELARARAARTTARAKTRSVAQNLERLQRVADKGLASGQEVAQATADEQTQTAELRATQQTLAALGGDAQSGDGARIELRAPVAGVVLTRDAVRGQTVASDHVLFVVADLEHAYFNARVFEKDLARVHTGSVAEVHLNAYPREPFVGRVENIGRALDQVQRTVLARISLQNRKDLLKVGLFGSALVVAADREPSAAHPVVPLSAVTQIADHDCLFVHESDGDFEVHRVTLGRSAVGKVEVVAGIRAGENVVTDGVFTLKSAVLKSTFGEDN